MANSVSGFTDLAHTEPFERVAQFTSPTKVLEITLLLACCSTRAIDTGWLLALLQHPLDWPYLEAIALRHQVFPLFYRRLESLGLEHLPPAVAQSLQEKARKNGARNLVLTNELLQLLHRFQNEGISVLTFKGPTLATLAYGDLSLRRFTDLDLFVPMTEIDRARQLLKEMGYRPQLDLTPAQDRVYTRFHYGYTFIHTHRKIQIDLHWDLLRQHFSFSPSPALIWAALDWINLAGQRVPTLRPEALLLFLCAHSAKDNWWQLKFVCDLAHLLQRQPDLNWDWIFSHAGQLGSRPMLDSGLLLAHQLLQAPLPPGLAEQLAAQPQLADLTRQVQQHLFRDSLPPAGQFFIPKIYLQTMDRWQDRLWFWLDVLTTPTRAEWQIVVLPPALAFLYYPLRSLRLLYKYSTKHWTGPVPIAQSHSVPPAHLPRV